MELGEVYVMQGDDLLGKVVNGQCLDCLQVGKIVRDYSLWLP